MAWIEAATCDLGLARPTSEESYLDGLEFLVDLDLVNESAPDPVPGVDWSREDFSSGQNRPAEGLEGPAPPPTGESFRPWTGLAVSALIHAVLLGALVLVSFRTSVGIGDYQERAFFVRLTDTNPVVALGESPGTIDSAASVASLAKRRPPRASEPVERSTEEWFQTVEHAITLDRDTSEPVGLTNTERMPEERPHEEHKLAREDPREVDSAGRSDSVDSIPWTASPPRTVAPSAGTDTADFRTGVLSAIEEAAYFPKNALAKRLWGKALVGFTIHRSGPVTGLSLVKSSGSDVLDEAALKIVEKAAKRFPAFPVQLQSEGLSYVVPIVFKAKTSAKD